MSLFVIVNPHAKRNKKSRRDIAERLGKIFGAGASIHRTQTLADVEVIAVQALASGCTVLGICGGDGTIHHTLSRFHKVYGEQPLPMILALGGGTMNMVCHSIKVLGPSERVARRFQAFREEGRMPATVKRNTMKIEDRLCFIFGVGLASNFLNSYYEGGDTGPTKAALIIQRAVISVMKRTDFAQQLFAPWRGKLAIDGVSVAFDSYTAVLVQTIENLGIGFTPMYRAFEKPSAFHVIATQMSPMKLVNHLPHIFFGRPMNHPDTHDTVGQALSLHADSDTMYTMDGDMYTARGPIHVVMGPSVEFAIV